MDASVIQRMARLLRAAAGAAGLDASDVQAGPSSIGIVGTGVDVTWARNALGRGKDGWQVRVTYHVADVGASRGRMTTEVSASYDPADIFQAARQAVMLVVQKRVEAALSEAV